MTKIVLATNNQGKVAEIQKILQPYHYTIIPQSDLHVSSIPETGLTFVENALIKARHASKTTGLPVLADDSGLVVDALNGRPGLHSARYAGENATDQMNIQLLLEHLSNEENRRAYFYCVLVFLRHPEDPTPIICEGFWQGHILREPLGDNGFGYDPLFYVPDYHCSAAELPLSIKNTLSHRAKALECLLIKLRNLSFE